MFVRVVGAGEVAGLACFLRGVFGGYAEKVLVIGFFFYDFENEIRFCIVRYLREDVGDLHGMLRVDFDFAFFRSRVFADFPEQGAPLELDELRDIDV